MQGPSLELEMRLKDQKVQVGLEALAAKEEKCASGLDKISKNAKLADAELTRFAKRTTEINTTPLEKYNRQLFVLDQALARGKVSQETFNRAVYGARLELDKAHTAQSRMMGGKVGEMAAQWLSVGSAIGLATAALQAHEVKSTTARNRGRDLADLRIELGQVGGPELQKRAAGLTKHGLTEKEALEFALNAQNLGFADDMEHFAQNKAGIGDLRKIAEIAGMAPQLLGGTVTPRQAVDMTFAAANPTRLSPGQMSPIIGRYALGATQQGTDADEVFALASVMSNKTPSPETGAQWMGTFQTKLSINEDERIRGKGVAGAMKALMEMPEADRKDFLKKDTETNALYQILKDALPEIEKRKEEIKSERLGGTLLQNTTARNLADPKIAAALKDVASEEELAQTREKRYGVDGSNSNTTKNNVMKNMEKNRRNAFELFAAEQGMKLTESFVGEENPGIVGGVGNFLGNKHVGNAMTYGPFTLLKEISDNIRTLIDVTRNKGNGGTAGGVGRSVSASASVPQN